MPSLFVWGIAFTISLVVMILTAGAGLPLMHLTTGALICLGIAFVAILENQRQRREGASKAEIAATTSRHMGFIYIWGAAIIGLTYMTILSWHEWWHWFAAFAVVGTLCVFFSNLITRDAAAGRTDNALMSMASKLTWVQLVAMIIAIVGMLFDGKLSRYLNPKHMDWAAQNTFFAGAVGLAILSAYALWAARNDRVA